MRPSLKEWHSFTRIWCANVAHLGRSNHYCRLAVAMADSDHQRHCWDRYLQLAIDCKAHWEETNDRRLQQRMASATAAGWTIAFNGAGWQATRTEMTVQAARLADLLQQIADVGDVIMPAIKLCDDAQLLGV